MELYLKYLINIADNCPKSVVHHAKRDSRCAWLSTTACSAPVVVQAIPRTASSCRHRVTISTLLFASAIK